MDPGNLFVTLAKKLVYGDVDLDGLYGPTETVVIADESASPIFCAADLLAQAEHEPPGFGHPRDHLALPHSGSRGRGGQAARHSGAG